MKILVVGLIKGLQIKRLGQEAIKTQDQVYGCHSGDLVIESDEVGFTPKVNGVSLTEYDLIYLCAGVESKMRLEWFTACDYLIKYTKTKVVNSVVVNGELNYYPIQTWFYLKQFENKIPFPKTFTVYNDDNIESLVNTLGLPFILKISEVHQGKGIFLINDLAQAKKVIEDNPRKVFVLRKFIPNSLDVRVFTVGFKAIGAMRRIAAGDDFRNNISQGGTGESFDLLKNPEIKELAEKASEISGIEVAGVDVLVSDIDHKPYILEVNVGPQFRGLEKYTGVNAASEIIRYFKSL